jgi:hypothetical protein
MNIKLSITEHIPYMSVMRNESNILVGKLQEKTPLGDCIQMEG